MVLDDPAFHEAVGEFRRLYPGYSTQEGARMMCTRASAEFIDLLLARGVIGGGWEVMEYAVIDGLSHWVARIGFVLVDWTARQFDPGADWPVMIVDFTCWH
jgi:hypothetical protein